MIQSLRRQKDCGGAVGARRCVEAEDDAECAETRGLLKFKGKMTRALTN